MNRTRKFNIEILLNDQFPTTKEKKAAIQKVCNILHISKSHFYRIRTSVHGDRRNLDQDKLCILRDFFQLGCIDLLLNEVKNHPFIKS